MGFPTSFGDKTSIFLLGWYDDIWMFISNTCVFKWFWSPSSPSWSFLGGFSKCVRENVVGEKQSHWFSRGFKLRVTNLGWYSTKISTYTHRPKKFFVTFSMSIKDANIVEIQYLTSAGSILEGAISTYMVYLCMRHIPVYSWGYFMCI